MPIDAKYGRVTTERGTIGGDEPIVIFRAQDRLLPQIIDLYRELCEVSGSPDDHLANLDRARFLVEQWQSRNRTKTPS